MGSTWGPSGANRTQVGPMLALLTLLSGLSYDHHGISRHWRLNGLFNILFRVQQQNHHRSSLLSAVTDDTGCICEESTSHRWYWTLCSTDPLISGDSPHKGPAMQKVLWRYDIIMPPTSSLWGGGEPSSSPNGNHQVQQRGWIKIQVLYCYAYEWQILDSNLYHCCGEVGNNQAQ